MTQLQTSIVPLTEALSTLEKFDNVPLSQSDISAYREAIVAAHLDLERRFDDGINARELVAIRSDFIDTILIQLWQRTELSTSQHALLAVGGYGRRELHPYSDIDIAIVLGGAASKSELATISALVTFLWDIGLEVGHSVRKVKECASAARDDLTIMTNLMEARHLCGASERLPEVCRLTATDKIWPTAKFFAAKVAEQAARHAKFDDAFQELEPNVKESPGGMRDIQVIAWVANRHFDATSLRGLMANKFLTETEGADLLGGEEFLWQIRCALHFKAGRREDRLLFEHQKSVASRFGYTDDDSNAAVENFMKDYYRTVRELSSLNEVLLGLFQEAILEPASKARVTPLNRRFQVRNNAIEVCDPSVFSRTPAALLEIFLLLQQHPEIIGIRAETIRLLRQNLHRIDEKFRNDLRAKSFFMEIIRHPRRIGHELQRMHRYGVLSAYLPVFRAVEGLMQFDLFHIYTVDEHSLFVVRNMRYFSFPRHENDQSKLVRNTIERIPKLELLYIAGLFHDIAKGRGGDHSDLGAEDAVAFCQSHGLSNYDTHVVAWLTRNHLVMSTIAQRKDIYDLDVIKEFAEFVGDQMHLDYLFLLTVADIRGTNPELWTSWKESLLSELYIATRRALHRGYKLPADQDEKIQFTRRGALEILDAQKFDGPEIEALWDSLGDNYFLRHRPDEIAWHTQSILSRGKDGLPIVAVRSFDERGATAVFIFQNDVDNLYALATSALDRLRLDVKEARIITSNSGFSLDTFMVVETDGSNLIRDADRIDQIRNKIRTTIISGKRHEVPAPRVASRKIKHFTIPTRVEFEVDKVHKQTVMEVIATDEPGVLSKIGRALQECDVRLHDARIATFGAHVEDYFYITDRNNKELDAEIQIPRLKDAVLTALGG
ncbi:MAG: [protein-PII] uridylyltransferase [Gammaproteobacteria bacterium]|jgi:[protein-PII] uridylyltransferase